MNSYNLYQKYKGLSPVEKQKFEYMIRNNNDENKKKIDKIKKELKNQLCSLTDESGNPVYNENFVKKLIKY